MDKSFSTSSDLLERVKNFLPKIEKANIELENAIKSGTVNNIRVDENLVAYENSNDVGDCADSESDSDRESEGIEKVALKSECEKNNSSHTESIPNVQLVFALGDFDNTVIALADSQQQEGDDAN
mmetsp:Transcript_33676/g.34300  ORF Transcript_33676/g.34300 Transcript_33676/m.34300 type:complete len:125 (-) Transcript_33676:27-401(-)